MRMCQHNSLWLWGFYIPKGKKKERSVAEDFYFWCFQRISLSLNFKMMLSGAKTGGVDGLLHSISFQAYATISVFISFEQKSDICLHLTYSEACFFMIRAPTDGHWVITGFHSVMQAETNGEEWLLEIKKAYFITEKYFPNVNRITR